MEQDLSLKGQGTQGVDPSAHLSQIPTRGVVSSEVLKDERPKSPDQVETLGETQELGGVPGVVMVANPLCENPPVLDDNEVYTNIATDSGTKEDGTRKICPTWELIKRA